MQKPGLREIGSYICWFSFYCLDMKLSQLQVPMTNNVLAHFLLYEMNEWDSNTFLELASKGEDSILSLE